MFDHLFMDIHILTDPPPTFSEQEVKALLTLFRQVCFHFFHIIDDLLPAVEVTPKLLGNYRSRASLRLHCPFAHEVRQSGECATISLSRFGVGSKQWTHRRASSAISQKLSSLKQGFKVHKLLPELMSQNDSFLITKPI